MIFNTNTNNTSVIESPLFRAPQAAQYLNISRSSFWRLIDSGAIPRVKLGQAAFGVLKSDIDDFIQQNRQA